MRHFPLREGASGVPTPALATAADVPIEEKGRVRDYPGAGTESTFAGMIRG